MRTARVPQYAHGMILTHLCSLLQSWVSPLQASLWFALGIRSEFVSESSSLLFQYQLIILWLYGLQRLVIQVMWSRNYDNHLRTRMYMYQTNAVGMGIDRQNCKDITRVA